MSQSGELLHGVAKDKIGKHVETLDGLLQNIRVNPETRYKMAMEAADTLIAQEFEAMSRQIGDHGIHHIGGNIETTMMILDEVPGKDSDRAKAAAYIAQIFHDTGYLTGPSRSFMDNGHPRWGAEHYDANVRGLVEEALGERWAARVTNMIANHAGTEVDWEEDLVGTAVRVADNLAVYHKEKLPPLFRYNTGTIKTLADMHFGQIDVDAARAKMTEQVRMMNHPEKMESALLRAVQEVGPASGKFTLGMLGGYLQGVDWLGNHMRVNIQRNKGGDLLNQMLDLGQKQASKFAKSFGLDPAKFLESGSELLRDSDGNAVLELILHGLKQLREKNARLSKYP
jgi:hypothetical protein